MLMWNNFFVQTSHDRVIYTDCFYRNMYKFKYIAIFDLDEVWLSVCTWFILHTYPTHDTVGFGVPKH